MLSMYCPCNIEQLILLSNYSTFQKYITSLFIKRIFGPQILTCNEAVNLAANSLGMPYSVVTADQGFTINVCTKYVHIMCTLNMYT